MTDPKPPTVRIELGDTPIRLEPERLHVLGSSHRADLRIDHLSVAPTHALLSVHHDHVVVEPVGPEQPVWVGDIRVHGPTEVPAGHGIRLGEIELKVVPPAASVRQTTATAHLRPPSFAELMAEELRRAPWFGMSLALHLLILLLLLQLVDTPPRGDKRQVLMAFDSTLDLPEIEPDLLEDAPPEVEETPDVPIEIEQIQDFALDPAEADLSFEVPDSRPIDTLGDMGAYFGEIMARGGDDILDAGSLSDSSGRAFRRTIEGLRAEGLEIVFVFDSTGSMGPVLDATRRRMTRMVEALYALVPDARIGVVTYRDHGRAESYVTRSVPLGPDFYRAMLFLYTVTAEGGGDRPEAVLEGLMAAIRQDWHAKSRRVVVLIGDAPAHPKSQRDITQQLRRFTGDAQRSAVHAIITSSDFFGAIQNDTEESFRRIAKDGDGLCLKFEDEERILEQVLTLAIGTEHRSSIAEVFAILDQRSRGAEARETPPRVSEVDLELRRSQIDPFFVARCIRSGDPDIAEHVASMLSDGGLRSSSHFAAAWIVQQMYDLPDVVIDPQAPPTRLSPAAAARLERLTARMRQR